MIQEQFIKPETASLARKAGFDWESRFDNQQQRDEWQQVALVEVSNPDYNDAMGDPYSDEFIPFMSPTKFVMLPHVTQSVLQKWLREKKGYHIYISHTFTVIHGQVKSAWEALYEKMSFLKPNSILFLEDDSGNSLAFDTYEEALEAAEQECLTKIIENQ